MASGVNSDLDSALHSVLTRALAVQMMDLVQSVILLFAELHAAG